MYGGCHRGERQHVPRKAPPIGLPAGAFKLPVVGAAPAATVDFLVRLALLKLRKVGRGLLVLVVEDDPSVRNLITTTLKTNDYRYVVAPNGSTAIMETTSHNPEIILLDLGLPDMDGVQVIQTVRSWSNVPIIVISARSEDNDKIKALDAGADDYLTKPFSVEELLARLRVTQRRLSLMTSEMVTASSVFVNGKLKVDYAGGCAYLGEDELHLTPIEYKLLCLLSKNVGKVLTHTFITQNIWGRSWDNDVASLRVFMATLRKKLEPTDESPQYIQTHIGVGYRMMKIE